MSAQVVEYGLDHQERKGARWKPWSGDTFTSWEAVQQELARNASAAGSFRIVARIVTPWEVVEREVEVEYGIERQAHEGAPWKPFNRYSSLAMAEKNLARHQREHQAVGALEQFRIVSRPVTRAPWVPVKGDES